MSCLLYFFCYCIYILLHGHVKIGYKVPQKMLSSNNVTDHVIIRCIDNTTAGKKENDKLWTCKKRPAELNGWILTSICIFLLPVHSSLAAISYQLGVNKTGNQNCMADEFKTWVEFSKSLRIMPEHLCYENIWDAYECQPSSTHHRITSLQLWIVYLTKMDGSTRRWENPKKLQQSA